LNNSIHQSNERTRGEEVDNPAEAGLAKGARLKAQGNQI
jgi:hypothetical protein